MTFGPGETSKVIFVPLVVDAVSEGPVAFNFNLSQPSSGIVSTTTTSVGWTNADSVGTTTYTVVATGLSVNDYLSIGAINGSESSSSAQFLMTRLIRAGDTSKAGLSYMRTQGGTATAGLDYTAVSQTLNWSANETFKDVRIAILDDQIYEGRESVIVQHSATADFAIQQNNTLWIGDNDFTAAGAVATTYSVSPHLTNVVEGSSGSVNYWVRRVGNPMVSNTVYLGVRSTSTATVGDDYVAPGVITLTFAEGEQLKSVSVSLLNNSPAEGNDTLVLAAYDSAANATAGGTTGRIGSDASATILDDDWTMGTTGSDIFSYAASMGYRYDADAGNDTVTVAKAAMAGLTDIRLGAGNDVLISGTTGNLLVAGALYDGGTEVDTIRFEGTVAFNIGTASASAPLFKGFEVLDLLTTTTVQTVNLTLNDVLQMTSSNAVPNLLKVMAQSTDKLNLTTWGIAAGTVTAATTLTDVDNSTTATVVADSDNNGFNEVTFGGQAYEIYSFAYGGGTVNMLMQQSMVTAGGVLLV